MRRTPRRWGNYSAQGGRTSGRIPKRLWPYLRAAGVLGVAWFAVEGGEYGTSDLVKQHLRRNALETAVDSLTREVDSLTVFRRRLATDPALQERIAREEFGLVREGELLYRIVDPTDSMRAPRR